MDKSHARGHVADERFAAPDAIVRAKRFVVRLEAVELHTPEECIDRGRNAPLREVEFLEAGSEHPTFQVNSSGKFKKIEFEFSPEIFLVRSENGKYIPIHANLCQRYIVPRNLCQFSFEESRFFLMLPDVQSPGRHTCKLYLPPRKFRFL